MAARKSLRARAEAGAAFMDEHEPGWADDVDAGLLNMNDARYCVLGQVGVARNVGDYHAMKIHYFLTYSDACDLGFAIGGEGWKRWGGQLTRLWQGIILGRQRKDSNNA